MVEPVAAVRAASVAEDPGARRPRRFPPRVGRAALCLRSHGGDRALGRIQARRAGSKGATETAQFLLEKQLEATPKRAWWEQMNLIDTMAQVEAGQMPSSGGSGSPAGTNGPQPKGGSPDGSSAQSPAGSGDASENRNERPLDGSAGAASARGPRSARSTADTLRDARLPEWLRVQREREALQERIAAEFEAMLAVEDGEGSDADSDFGPDAVSGAGAASGDSLASSDSSGESDSASGPGGGAPAGGAAADAPRPAPSVGMPPSSATGEGGEDAAAKAKEAEALRQDPEFASQLEQFRRGPAPQPAERDGGAWVVQGRVGGYRAKRDALEFALATSRDYAAEADRKEPTPAPAPAPSSAPRHTEEPRASTARAAQRKGQQQQRGSRRKVERSQRALQRRRLARPLTQSGSRIRDVAAAQRVAATMRHRMHKRTRAARDFFHGSSGSSSDSASASPSPRPSASASALPHRGPPHTTSERPEGGSSAAPDAAPATPQQGTQRRAGSAHAHQASAKRTAAAGLTSDPRSARSQRRRTSSRGALPTLDQQPARGTRGRASFSASTGRQTAPTSRRRPSVDRSWGASTAADRSGPVRLPNRARTARRGSRRQDGPSAPPDRSHAAAPASAAGKRPPASAPTGPQNEPVAFPPRRGMRVRGVAGTPARRAEGGRAGDAGRLGAPAEGSSSDDSGQTSLSRSLFSRRADRTAQSIEFGGATPARSGSLTAGSILSPARDSRATPRSQHKLAPTPRDGPASAQRTKYQGRGAMYRLFEQYHAETRSAAAREVVVSRSKTGQAPASKEVAATTPPSSPSKPGAQLRRHTPAHRLMKMRSALDVEDSGPERLQRVAEEVRCLPPMHAPLCPHATDSRRPLSARAG